MSEWYKCPPWKINCAMLKLVGYTGTLLNYPHYADKVSAGVYSKTSDSYAWYDYCGDMGLLWPIMLKYRVSVDMYYNGSYTRVWGYCDTGIVEIQCTADNITKAIAALCLTLQDCGCTEY